MNPFLDRQKVVTGHGSKSEKRVAKRLGARLQPASGAIQGMKSDAVLKESNFRLEMKSTVSQSIKLDMGWFSKISKEARDHAQHPALIISFVDGEGKPMMKQDSEWVCLPLHVFKELTDVN